MCLCVCREKATIQASLRRTERKLKDVTATLDQERSQHVEQRDQVNVWRKEFWDKNQTALKVKLWTVLPGSSLTQIRTAEAEVSLILTSHNVFLTLNP